MQMQAGNTRMGRLAKVQQCQPSYQLTGHPTLVQHHICRGGTSTATWPKMWTGRILTGCVRPRVGSGARVVYSSHTQTCSLSLKSAGRHQPCHTAHDGGGASPDRFRAAGDWQQSPWHRRRGGSLPGGAARHLQAYHLWRQVRWCLGRNLSWRSTPCSLEHLLTTQAA